MKVMGKIRRAYDAGKSLTLQKDDVRKVQHLIGHVHRFRDGNGPYMVMLDNILAAFADLGPPADPCPGKVCECTSETVEETAAR